VIRLEEGKEGRLRVIGSLRGPALKVLFEAISAGPVVLDLTEVSEADENAVRFLAGLSPERCTLASCPMWLALWIERVTQAKGEGVAGPGVRAGR